MRVAPSSSQVRQKLGLASPLCAPNTRPSRHAGATAALRGSAKFILLSAPKFALRSLAQSLAREFQPKVCDSIEVDAPVLRHKRSQRPDMPQKVHVALVNIDGQIFSERMKARMPDKPMDT